MSLDPYDPSGEKEKALTMTTYAQAHEALRDHMESTGDWNVRVRSTCGPRKNLKVLYAQHEHSFARVWFRAQALYLGYTANVNGARSLDQLGSYDIRRETPQQTLARIERRMED